ncbi:MAG: SCP2 sterol-binding domain-containing protein [Solirubrobacteraceae bacterium]
MNCAERRPRRRWFPELKAQTLAWWVRTAPEQRLQSVMRSPLRGVLLWQIFRTIAQRAEPDARLEGVVEFRISGRRDGGIDRCQLTLSDGRCRASRNGGGRPALTLELGSVAFLQLVGGSARAHRLLIAGRLRLRGDLMFALALPAALRLPGRRRQAPSRER